MYSRQTWSFRDVTVVGTFVSLVVALSHAAFYWGVGTSPQAVGISYGELVGQAAFGTMAIVGVLLGLTVILAWITHMIAGGIVEAEEWARMVRTGPPTVLVLAAAFGVGVAALFTLARLVLPEALEASAVVSIAVVVLLTRPLLKPRPRTEEAESWPAVPWQASWGFAIACVTALTAALALTDILGQGLSSTAIDIWVAFFVGAGLLSPVGSAIVIVRMHRRGRLPEDIGGRSTAVTVLALGIGLAAFAGLGAVRNVRLVDAGRIPSGVMHILSGAPVHCVHVHWRTESNQPPWPSPALRLGAAEGHEVLVHHEVGAMTPATDEVTTRPAGEDECIALIRPRDDGGRRP